MNNLQPQNQIILAEGEQIDLYRVHIAGAVGMGCSAHYLGAWSYTSTLKEFTLAWHVNQHHSIQVGIHTMYHKLNLTLFPLAHVSHSTPC